MDTLDRIFASLDMAGSVFYRSTLTSPWRIDLAAENVPKFHIVLTGEAYLGFDTSNEPICLCEGDAILVRGGESHWIGDSPDPDHISPPMYRYELAR